MDSEVASSQVVAASAVKHGPSDESFLSALQMVDSVRISNFRGFSDLLVEDLSLINIIVGDNAVGKTAFLEAMYLAVSGHAQQFLKLKQWLGQDISFQAGSVDSLAEQMYSDLFYNANSTTPIVIDLNGHGFEKRKLSISRAIDNVVVSPPNRKARRAEGARNRNIDIVQGNVFVGGQQAELFTVPILMTWTDQYGVRRDVRLLLGKSGELKFEGTNEALPNCYFFTALSAPPSFEAAGNYSALVKRKQSDQLKMLFRSVFDDIGNIESAGSGVGSIIMADIPWAKELLPLPIVSGGVNRAASILLAITHRERGLVLVDEIETGLFHRRQTAFGGALMQLARSYKTQLMLTTHSEEWIRNFLGADGGLLDDIAFWRMERSDKGMPRMRRFTAAQFRAGLNVGEMR